MSTPTLKKREVMVRGLLLGGALLWGGGDHRALAQSFAGLGHLPDSPPHSVAWDISPDGRYISGANLMPDDQFTAVAWIPGIQGPIDLGRGAEPWVQWSHAFVTNGGVIGGALGGELENGQRMLVAFADRGDGIVSLPPLPGAEQISFLEGISADGEVLVGFSGAGDRTEATIWISDEIGPIGLGDFPGGRNWSVAKGVSDDGSIICGFGHHPNDVREAFIWRGNGLEGLGFLSESTRWSSAKAISPDGVAVVGFAWSDDAQGVVAFVWRDGQMIDLGELPGDFVYSDARDCSNGGQVIVGRSAGVNGFEAVIWIDDQLHSLRQLLIDRGLGNELAGWRLFEATSISADGRTVVGMGTNPDGNTEAWRAELW